MAPSAIGSLKYIGTKERGRAIECMYSASVVGNTTAIEPTDCEFVNLEIHWNHLVPLNVQMEMTVSS